MQFRALLVGDLVGKPGRRTLAALLPDLLRDEEIDVVIVNAENAAGGSGIVPAIIDEIHGFGVDCITLGDHCFRKKEAIPRLKASERLIRPANLPAEAAGRGWTLLESQSGFPFAVVDLMGRTFMKPVADCPFHAIDRILTEIGTKARLIFVEVHAEATSDRIAMGWHLDGRVTAVYGTHTHVQTADERVLPGGTGYITDLGMTGPHDGVLGRRKDKVLSFLRTSMPTHFTVSKGDLRLTGAIVTADTATGRATGVDRVALSVPEPPAEKPDEKPEGETPADASAAERDDTDEGS